MKLLVGILVLLAVLFTGWKIWVYWEEVNLQKEKSEQAANREIHPERLEGLPQRYEQSLRQAQEKGALSLKEWLDQAKTTSLIKDPRLAWVELDYVVMVATENPVEAKRVFAEVKRRVTEDSPVYRRVKSLEKTFE